MPRSFRRPVGSRSWPPRGVPAALLLAVAWLPGIAASRAAAGQETRAADEAAIRAAANAYVAALAKGDTAALAALWTPDGDIVDAEGGVLVGREAAALEKDAGGGERPEFRIRETRLRFLTADVAVEDGTVEVVPAEGEPLSGRFTATWVRHDGAWKLAALREARGGEATAAEALADLDWMVGDWLVVDDPESTAAAAADQPAIEVSCRWNDTKTFLTRVMRISPRGGGQPLEITQRIGWDPLAKAIHSWAFGSDGSLGEAEWSRDGRSWVARSRAVTLAGGQSTSLNIYTYDGKDRCAWRSLPTHVGGEHVPPVTMTMIRKPPAAGTEPRGTP